MDVDEFLLQLCDRLEEYLKNSSHADILKRVWCGTTASQLIGRGQGCSHQREREEVFYTVPLDIKGKNRIEEALELFVQGEPLEGENAYKCDECNAKVDTLKRSVVSQLPSTLILTLKRFDFNFDTMRKQKINDHCEFPMTLNMFPYTKEGIAAKELKAKQEAAAAEAKEAKDLPPAGEKGASASSSASSVAATPAPEASTTAAAAADVKPPW